MNKTLSLLLLAGGCVLSCSSPVSIPITPLPYQYQQLSPQSLIGPEADIVEAVVRYEMQPVLSGNEVVPETCFLSIGRHDPTPEFLAKFAGCPIPVKPCSRAGDDGKGSVFDAAARHRGFIVFVDEISWLSDKRVAVKAGNLAGNLAAEWAVYELNPIDGKWTITKRNAYAVS